MNTPTLREIQDELDQQGVGQSVDDEFGVCVLRRRRKGRLVFLCHWPDGRREVRTLGTMTFNMLATFVAWCQMEFVFAEREESKNGGE